MNFVAHNFCLISGFSSPTLFEIQSFDCALLCAGISDYNLVRVSSILPPNCSPCEQVSLPKGSILHTAFATFTKKGEGLISSSISVGVPKDSHNVGVIMEHSLFGNKESCIKITESLAIQAMKYRNIDIKNILSIGCETHLCLDKFVTTFAGLAMW